MELAFVRQDTEVRTVVKCVLTTLMAKIVHKNVSAKMVPLVYPRMADATVQQVISYTITSTKVNQLIRINIQKLNNS